MKSKVLILTDWFIPGFKAGGPIQSVKNLVENTKDEIGFTIITGDRDLNEKAQYGVERFDQKIQREGYQVIYTTAENRSSIIRQELDCADYDQVYLNSLFSIDFTIKPILYLQKSKWLNKVILAPRGMLGQGALRLKRNKKRIFITLVKLLKIHKEIIFHSTDKTESVDIFKVFGQQIKIVEIGNLPGACDAKAKSYKADHLSIIFASRVSPKKNLLAAVKFLAVSGLECKLSVYGEMEDIDYMKRCESISDNNVSLKFYGAVAPDILMERMREHDFFILPTLNENFGHSIIEALSLGLPVMISDQTPWNDLNAFGAGWVIPLNEEARWIKSLNQASQLTDAEYEKMSAQAIQYVSEKIDIAEIRGKYLQLFNGQ